MHRSPFLFTFFRSKIAGKLSLILNRLQYKWEAWLKKNHAPLQGVIIASLLFPVFFQLQGAVFSSADLNFDANGILTELPLPLSSFTLFLGLAFLVRYDQATKGAGIIFTLFMLMLLSTFSLAPAEEKIILSKLIFLVQIILPVFALALGLSYISPKNRYLKVEYIFLYVLIAIIPIQLAASFISNPGGLSTSLFAFSIYQHQQYVPVMFVGGYFLALSTLLDKDKTLSWLSLLLAPLVSTYIILSASLLSIAFGLLSACTLLAVHYRHKICKRCLTAAAVYTVFSIVMLSAIYMAYSNETAVSMLIGNGAGSSLNGIISNYVNALSNVGFRIDYWQYYFSGITEGVIEFLLGHAYRPEANIAPSAYNYYLDIIYNFGFISLIPILYLMALTLKTACSLRGKWNANLIALAWTLFFLIFVDNFFKVGLRQPYPGIATFYLWGVFLSKISIQPRLANKEIISR